MSEHLPECELREPCSTETPDHGFCGRQNTYCIHCERACICVRLRACETRVAAAFHKVRADDQKQAERFGRDQFDAGYADAITQTMQRIESMPAGVMPDYVGRLVSTILAAVAEMLRIESMPEVVLPDYPGITKASVLDAIKEL